MRRRLFRHVIVSSLLMPQRSYGTFGKARNRVTPKEQNKYNQPFSVVRCAVKLSHERRFKVTRVNGVLMFIHMLGDGT